MYYILNNMTDMSIIIIFVLSIIIGCLIASYVLVKFKFYPIIYFYKGEIKKDRLLSEIENVHLKNMKQKYGLILSVIPILGFSWGLFGITLTCFIAFNKFIPLFSSQDINFLLNIVNYWVISNIMLLSVIPLLFLFTRAMIPVGMKRSFNRKFLAFLLIIILFGLVFSKIDYHLSLFGLFVLFLLAIPCIFSSWFIGQYIAVYVIRSFFQTTGWDFVLNEKTSFFGRIKGFFSFIFAFLTPILALNSFIAVLDKNTNKGGFLGIWFLSLTKTPFTFTFTIVNPWTFTLVNPWTFTLTESVFGIFTNVIILFLIVGPLVTFIFRPTYIFELTLNSKIYQTLINFNWDNFKENINSKHDCIIIHSLTTREMLGIMIFFISFINYIAIISVGAVIASFQINLDQIIGLGFLNGTIKLIEIPVLFFVEYLILHDLSEERELVHLALKGRRLSKRDPNFSSYTTKIMVPETMDKSQLH